MRSLVIVALAAAVLGSISGCTRQEQRSLRRAWKDAAGSTFDRVDLNSASRKELADVPGLDANDADRIIKNRPYGRTYGLVKKDVLTEEKYRQVRDYLYVD